MSISSFGHAHLAKSRLKPQRLIIQIIISATPPSNTSQQKMYVYKRDGKKETVHFDKITSRINKLCYGLDPVHVDAAYVRRKKHQLNDSLHNLTLLLLRQTFQISQKVVQGVYPGVTTIELDELAAQTAASLATRHPDFSILAARISVSNLHKQTSKVFSDVVQMLHDHVHPKTLQVKFVMCVCIFIVHKFFSSIHGCVDRLLLWYQSNCMLLLWPIKTD